jgi:flagellar basal-body rod protein FlgB
MSNSDLPIFTALRTRMQWHQERQRVLAENVANSDTPNFKPRDLVEPKFDPSGAAAGGPLALARTSTGQSMTPSGAPENFDQTGKGAFETRPAGNSVNLEDEMLKIAQNQMDYEAVTGLYTRNLHMLKTAIGKA